MQEADFRVVVMGGTAPSDFEHVLGSLGGPKLAVIAHCVNGRKIVGDGIVHVTGTTKVEAGRVYSVPGDQRVEIEDQAIVVAKQTASNNVLDILFRSVAEHFGARSIGVILGGPGTNGVLGIKRIKEVGGIAIAQAITDGEQSEMPRSAISSGTIDLVLPLAEIAPRLHELGNGQRETSPSGDASADTLRDILTLVRIRTGHDFSAYKRATLFRRASRRMQICQTDSLSEYHRYLREHPSELTSLLRDFLITVTSFFRDPDAFATVAEDVVPKLFLDKQPTDQVRVWVPGCATGEEAYSIGMLLSEYASKIGARLQLQLFATDIDEQALVEARNGRYPESIAVDVSPQRLEQFFVRENGYYRVNKELRDIVLFSPHNVLRDPPFSRLDLITCRNLLIYLNREAQGRVLSSFHFGLKPQGYLFLGSSESADNSALFGTIDPNHRLFQRRTSSQGIETIIAASRWHVPTLNVPLPASHLPSSLVGDLHYRVVEQYAPPSILIDAELDVIHVSEHAGRYLAIAGGEPTRQILRLVLPQLRLDLRASIFTAKQPGERADRRIVRFEHEGQQRAVEIRVVAHKLDDVAPGTLLVLFDEKTLEEPVEPPVASTVSIEPVVRDMEDELLRTRDRLRVTIEQYETSLEELKASNEELQAINEELRSASEELETSKEELQSVNEELTTLNHELKTKIDEVSHANSDLQNLMMSTDIGVVFLDRQLNIKRFTPRAQDLFNLIPTDIGRPLAHLTHKLSVNDVSETAMSVMQSLRTVERDVADNEGHRFLMRLLPYRSLDDRIDGVVITFVDVTPLREAIEARRRSETTLQAVEERLRLAVKAAPMVVLGVDHEGSSVWGHAFGREIREGGALEMFVRPTKFAGMVREALATKANQHAELELIVDGKKRSYDFHVEPTTTGVNAVGFDISARSVAQATLVEADRIKDEFLATLSHELRNPLTPLKGALDLAKLGDNDPAKRKKFHDIMSRQVAEIEKIVDELLDVARITQGKVELLKMPIELAAIVESALEATRELLADREQDLRLEVPKGLLVVADPARLVQVVTNLVTNAAKFTPDKGTIALATRSVPERNVIELRVRDNGIGISAELLPRIFDIFIQGRAHGSGLGIGLHLVRRLVELHGGSVTATSDGENRGSEFVVELPAS